MPNASITNYSITNARKIHLTTKNPNPATPAAASATNSQMRTIKVKQTTGKPSVAAIVPTKESQIPTTISRESKSSRKTSLTIALITSASVLFLGALLLIRYLSGKNNQENTLYHPLTDVIDETKV